MSRELRNRAFLLETIQVETITAEVYIYAVPVVPADEELPTADITAAVGDVESLSEP